MDRLEMEWAATHSWYITCESMPNDKYSVIVHDYTTLRTDGLPIDQSRFVSYKELREWAGY